MISPARLRLRILACGLFFLVLNTYALFHNFPQALSGKTDFRSLYAAGAIVRTGHADRLYDYDLERTVQNTLIGPQPGALPFLYPAYAALPFVPLSALPYPTAYLALLAINLALLCASARVLRPHLPALCNLFPLLPTLIFLAFLPAAIAFYQGQVSFLLFLLFCTAYAAIESNKPLTAGLLLSLILVKFHVVIPVILLFLVWRVWRLVAGFAVGATTLALVTLTLQGTSGVRLYAQTLLSATSTGAIGLQNPYTVFSAKMPNLHGFCFSLLGSSPWATALVLLSSTAVLIVTALQPPSLPRALVAALLVSYHLHMHDLTLLLLPLSLALNEALAAYRSQVRQPSRLRTATSLLWLTSPIGLYLIAIAANGIFAPAMLPFLMPSASGGDTQGSKEQA